MVLAGRHGLPGNPCITTQPTDLPPNLELVFRYIGGSGQTGISLAIPPSLEGIYLNLPPTGPVTVVPTSTSTTSPTATITPVPPLPVSAAFSANPVTGIVPLTVQFTDTSVGPVVSWLWSGDGNTSTAQNPLYPYVAPGTLMMSLFQSAMVQDSVPSPGWDISRQISRHPRWRHLPTPPAPGGTVHRTSSRMHQPFPHSMGLEIW